MTKASELNVSTIPDIDNLQAHLDVLEEYLADLSSCPIELVGSLLAVISIYVQNISPSHISYGNSDIQDLVARLSLVTDQLGDPNTNYYLANIATACGNYDLANQLFSKAHQCCETVSDYGRYVCEQSTGEFDERGVERIHAAILCNWATLPRDGLGQPINIDQCIDMYRHSGKMGMMVALGNTANMLIHRFEKYEGINADIIEAFQCYKEAASNLIDDTASRLDFSDNEDQLIYQYLSSMANMLDNPCYLEILGYNGHLMSDPLLDNTQWLFRTMIAVSRPVNEEHGYVCGEHCQEHCLNDHLSNVSSLLLSHASAELINKPILINERSITDSAVSDQEEIVDLLDENIYRLYNNLIEHLEKGEINKCRLLNPLNVWVSLLSVLGWDIAHTDNGNRYTVEIEGKQFHLVCADAWLSDMNFTEDCMTSDYLAAHIDGYNESTNMIVFSSVAGFRCRTPGGSNFIPILIVPAFEPARLVSLNRYLLPDELMRQYRSNIKIGESPYTGDVGQYLAIAVNATIFSMNFDKELVNNVVPYVGVPDSDECLPAPNLELFSIAQFAFHLRSPAVASLALRDQALLYTLLLLVRKNAPAQIPSVFGL